MTHEISLFANKRTKVRLQYFVFIFTIYKELWLVIRHTSSNYCQQIHIRYIKDNRNLILSHSKQEKRYWKIHTVINASHKNWHSLIWNTENKNPIIRELSRTFIKPSLLLSRDIVTLFSGFTILLFKFSFIIFKQN